MLRKVKGAFRRRFQLAKTSSEDELREVLTEIVQLMREAGYDGRATWLSERLYVLSDVETTPERLDEARTELHGIVLGMGGLIDHIMPRPASGRPYDLAATQRLHSLADRLYRLTNERRIS